MLRRACSFYHMMGFTVSCSCQRINDLGMIILCLKDQNSHKCKRPRSLVLSHLLSLMISVFWAKWIATLPHLPASLVLILLLPVQVGEERQTAEHLQSCLAKLCSPLGLAPMATELVGWLVELPPLKVPGQQSSLISRNISPRAWRERKSISKYLQMHKLSSLLMSCFSRSLYMTTHL